MEKEVRVIMFQDGDVWVAQCLEHDIGAQARTLKELEVRLALTIEAECRQNGDSLDGIDPAPKLYHDMWEGRTGEYRPTRDIRPRDSNLMLELALCA